MKVLEEYINRNGQECVNVELADGTYWSVLKSEYLASLEATEPEAEDN